MPAITSVALAVGATALAAQASYSIYQGVNAEDPPGVQAAPDAPTSDDPAIAARLEEQRRAGGRGRASTMLSDSSFGLGATSQDSASRRTMLGAAF